MPVSESLTEFVEKKLESLFSKYPWLIKAQVYIKKQQKNIDKECACEIELSLPGPRIYASATAKNFELSIKRNIIEISRQLEKVKDNNFAKQH